MAQPAVGSLVCTNSFRAALWTNNLPPLRLGLGCRRHITNQGIRATLTPGGILMAVGLSRQVSPYSPANT
eukprot:scaffold8616_cov169-Skeletonema_marinoi.AAC.3